MSQKCISVFYVKHGVLQDLRKSNSAKIMKIAFIHLQMFHETCINCKTSYCCYARPAQPGPIR